LTDESVLDLLKLSSNVNECKPLLVGRTVCKEFEGEMFTGRVKSFDPKVEWFRVVYSDGDKEDMELDVLASILVS